MKWSIRIGRIAGIDLYLHATFLILVAWLAASQYLSSRSTLAMLSATGFILLLFVIIVLHELGHALAARRYGIETKDITLLPIGGVARMERMPEKPSQELVVAFAGPLVNLVIAAGIFVGILISAGPSNILTNSLDSKALMAQLLWVNLWLAFFNLLPAFPMDGGRVLRALLSLKLGRERATEIAVGVGHVMALIFGAVGILVLSNPFLVFIALFVWVGADGELQQVRMHAYLHGVLVQEVMAREFETIEASTPLSQVARELVPGFQNDFPVMEGDRLIGFIGLDSVARGMAESGGDGLAGFYAQREFEIVAPNDSLEDVVADWQPDKGSFVAVFDEDKLVGIVTSANIGEYVMLKSALARNPRG